MPHINLHSLSQPVSQTGATLWPRAKRIFMAGVAMALAACASMNSLPPEELVRLRATERWQALIISDFKKAHGYNTKAYQALITADQFRTRVGSSVVWTRAEVMSVKCDDQSNCKAKIRLDYRAAIGTKTLDGLNTYFTESWVLDAGSWQIHQEI